MISNLELSLKEEFSRSRKEGIKQGIEQGIQKGIQKGIHQGVIKGKKEDIIELLSEIGNISELLYNKIEQEKDIDVLTLMLKLAAKSKSIEEFEKNLKM